MNIALENHVIQMRLIHGQQCREDQDCDVTFASTVKAQTDVAKFNRAMVDLNKTNPDHAVIKLLECEIRKLKMAADQ